MRLLHTREAALCGSPHGCTYTRRSHWQPVQAHIVGTTTAVVVVEGRDGSEFEWEELIRFTETGAGMIGPRRELRAHVVRNAGQVTVDYADGQHLPPLRR